jgi:hypothetical protein
MSALPTCVGSEDGRGLMRMSTWFIVQGAYEVDADTIDA